MQALKTFIPTDKKKEYINELFKVGFDMIDVGSFVSSRAVPQMKDTAEVLEGIKDKFSSKVSVLVGNERYAEDAAKYDIVDYLNYPFSISDIFQKKNMNANLDKSIRTVEKILNICEKNKKKPNITIAVAFGNPYDEDWGIDILMDWVEVLYNMGLRYIPLADTTASGSPHLIGLVFDNVIREFPDVEFNFHLHTKSKDTISKIEAAYNSGCRNFDTVFNSMGGCPMSGKELVANLNTLDFVNWLDQKNINHNIKKSFFDNAIKKALDIFS